MNSKVCKTLFLYDGRGAVVLLQVVKLTITGKQVDKAFSLLVAATRREEVFDVATLRCPRVWTSQLETAVTERVFALEAKEAKEAKRVRFNVPLVICDMYGQAWIEQIN